MPDFIKTLPSVLVRGRKNWNTLFPVIFAFCLLAPLWMVRSSVGSSQPWRAELTTAALAFLVMMSYVVFDPSARVKDDISAFRAYSLWLAGFAFWGLVSGIWAQQPIAAVHHTIVWCEFIFFFSSTIRWLKRGNIRTVTSTLLLAGGIVGMLTLFDYATMPDFLSQAKALRARYTAYAEMIATIVPVALAVSLYGRNASRSVLAWLLTALSWIAVMLSLGKSGFIGGVIGLAVTFVGYFLFGDKLFRKRLLIAAGVWLVLTAGIQFGSSRLAEVPATVDLISGKADTTRETSLARIFFWRVGSQMVRDHWLIGVGADNFGVAFNESRARFRATSPDSPMEELVPEYIVERAHNEPLQILAELGIVGLLLAAIPFTILVVRLIGTIRAKRKLSLMFWAAAGGMAAFAASSMSSSFSFRIVQNGIVFFIVFGIAAYEVKKTLGRDTKARKKPEKWLPTCIAMISLSILFVVVAGILILKGVSEYESNAADGIPDNPSAIAMYDQAAFLDPDNEIANLKSSVRSYAAKDYGEAARKLQVAIDGGLGVDITYSALADCYERMGDLVAAQRTFDEALRIYPHDIFLRVRYATLLAKIGHEDLAEENLAVARKVDPRATNGWYALLTKGSVRAFYQARSEPETVAEPNELKPSAAVLQYLDKTPGDVTQP